MRYPAASTGSALRWFEWLYVRQRVHDVDSPEMHQP